MIHEKLTDWTPPILQTERLILRAITLEDAPAMFNYSSNPKITQYVLWNAHKTVQDSENFIRNYAFSKYAAQEPEPFAITLKSDPQIMIGTVGCFWANQQSQCLEMGYALSEEHWGNGILPEAAKEVMRYCFEEYSQTTSPVNRIQAHCKLENTASARVMEKIGMQFEAIHRERVLSKGRFWDMKVYAILKSDYLKNKGTQK